ncbi:cysteine proteinase inhibitor 12-like [Silene latifolia]|uniref:cysteine proteinase inhibitor 12-like n=1 Tax=Silene latifolia TaxID=37657 RepID=UPI003D778557
MNPKSSASFVSTAMLVIVLLIGSISELGFCREFGIVRLENLGGQTYDFSNSDEVQSIARFAVQEHNKRTNAMLKFGRVLKAKEQVVAGKLYHLTLEAVDAGKKTVYEAKVWVKPWMNFKQLQEFKRVMDIHFTTSDLGFVRDGFGWHKVPVHDPEVQDAANHAVTAIQQRSNSLFPYKLLEILQAEAEVVKDIVKYNLLLKLRRGSKDEKFKVNVDKNTNGGFILNMFEQPDM